MTFSDIFAHYLSQYQITLSALSEETGISRSMLSRMKNGRKEPGADSELLEELAKGICMFVRANGDTQTDWHTIKEILAKPLHTEESFDMGHIVDNLNFLIASLEFRVSDLSRYLNFDASYLSLIRSGKRKPSDISTFCNGIAEFISLQYDTNLSLLNTVLDCRKGELTNRKTRQDYIYKWLTEHSPQVNQSALHFLKALDVFNLNEFIGAIQFGEESASLKAAEVPLHRNYYQKDGFMQAELDWLNAVIASPSTKPVLFYSDMPIEELSKNAEFSKQWMLRLALLLKKGIHLNMIHQIDRQESEMMLGLEAWIPLYMTGQVSPYYLKESKSRTFHHFMRTSDVAVLSGEAITGFYDDGRYQFSSSREDIDYYRTRGDELLSKARPLIAIYRSENAAQYCTFLESQLKKTDNFHRNILSSPPIYTISPELLEAILKKNHASDADFQAITAYAREYRQWAEEKLCDAFLDDELSELSEEAFREYSVSLPLSDLFLEREYTYTYEDYCAHLQQTKDFASQHPNYTVSLNPSPGFRNIQIRISEGKFVLISKENYPTIHFVIHHPKLRSAIEHLSIPIVEKKA